MGQQEIEAGGDYDMLSVQPPPQKEDMPEIESKDAVMSDPNFTEVRSQDQALDTMVDIQIIARDESDNACNSDLAKDLRAASKIPGEAAVEQKPDTESLMIKLNALEDQLETAHRDRQSSACEQGKTQTELANTKQALLDSKDRLRDQKRTIKKLRADRKKSKGNVRAEKAINSDLQGKLATSQKELTDCKDDVFSLQPMVPVADSRVVKELEILSQKIVHWIETEVDAFEKANPEAKEDFIFSVLNDGDAAMFLKNRPGAGEHLVRYLIHRFFQTNLFGRRFRLLGLTEETAQLLQKVEGSMAILDPPRGPANVATWRSETLQALAATGECQQTRKIQLHEMSKQLFQELGWTFPILFSRKGSMESFYQQVLEPAAKVATIMQTSASTYRYSMSDQPFRNWKPLGLRHMKTHTMLDIKNGSYLKANAAIIADKRGNIGGFIMPLEPGLYRTREGKDETTLRRVTYLVELNHPVA